MTNPNHGNPDTVLALEELDVTTADIALYARARMSGEEIRALLWSLERMVDKRELDESIRSTREPAEALS